MDEEEDEHTINCAVPRDDNLRRIDDFSLSRPQKIAEGFEQILAGETESKESLKDGLDF